MIRIKNTKLTRVISIATVLVVLLAIAGTALWTTGDTLPVQAQDLPDGFEYGDRAKVLPDLIIIEGVNYTVQNQAEGFRLPLHSTYSVGETVIKQNTGNCSGDVQCGNVNVTNGYDDFEGTFVAEPSSEDESIVAIDDGKFKGVGVGTVFVKVAAGATSDEKLRADDGSSIRFAITVHEPEVWTRDVGIPDVTVDEGDTANFTIIQRRAPEAASVVHIDYDAVPGITFSADSFTINADGTIPSPITITAARDDNRDDEVVYVEFYFASGGDYHYNGRFAREVAVRVNDRFGAVVVPPTPTATPVPAEQRQADEVCANLTGTAETNCLLREVLNELQEANAPPVTSN